MILKWEGFFLAQHAESSTAHHVPVMTSNPACKNMYPVCAGLKVPHAPDTHTHTDSVATYPTNTQKLIVTKVR